MSPGRGERSEVTSFEGMTADDDLVVIRWMVAEASASFWAYLASPTWVVSVRAPDLEPPRGRTLEVRGDGVWADGVCEIPDEHWSLALEAFAVRLDGASDGWAGERGERIPFGFDLDWESSSAPVGWVDGTAQAGELSGEVVIGNTRIDLVGPCLRSCLYDDGTTKLRELRWIAATGTVEREEVDELAWNLEGLAKSATVGDNHFETHASLALVSNGIEVQISSGRLGTPSGTCPGWLEIADDVRME